ncbi:MAG: hypothetical protein J6Z01_08570 [Bacteroidales bacterium]|nr:hypothetical protein [Bacteroidales bacterium]
MRKLIFILLFIIPVHALCQDDVALRTFIDDILTHKIKIYQSNNRDSLIGFDTKVLRRSFNYLSKYDTDSIIFKNLPDYAEILWAYMLHSDKEIRHKALHLFLDTYRLSGGSSGVLPIKPDDVDNKIKTKILNIISNKPYSEKELKVLTTKKEQYYKQVYTDKYLLKHRRIDTTIMSLSYARDSLINRSMEEYSESLKTPSYNIEILSELCAWFYIYEAIPYIEKYLETHNNHRIKVHLARLGVEKYEDEIIEDNFKKKVFSFAELIYINTPKSMKAIIQSLRIEGKVHGYRTVINEQGEYVTIEGDGMPYKLTNLQILVDGKYLTNLPYVEKYKMENLTIDDIINPPSEDIAKWINKELDESFFPLCEEVAKWMEENIDKLEVNPNIRF